MNTPQSDSNSDQAPGPPQVSELEDQLKLRFHAPELLRASLTHRSYAFEHGGVTNNERLEFLGDSVLGLVVTDMIFSQFPHLPEGEMAKLRAATVNMAVLADVARALDLGAHLLLGRGEEFSAGRGKSSILADALEAVIGAVYLDQGLEETRRLIADLMGDYIRTQVEQGLVRDYKTSLQERSARAWGSVPEYRITSTGPDHAKSFQARVYLRGELQGAGSGHSKKEAEQEAAREALLTMQAVTSSEPTSQGG